MINANTNVMRCTNFQNRPTNSETVVYDTIE